MSTGARISAVVNTYNAHEYLDEVLTALKDFDEIVVCDMESTDDTVEIARRHGCKVVTFPKGDISIVEPARNFAIQSASCPWVLVVDADEIVTPELREYLYMRVRRGDCPEALDVPMVNRFMGRFSKTPPDYHVRFFRRDKADWPPTIHSKVRIDGRTERIPASIKNVHFLHLADASMRERIEKLDRYTDRELERRRSKNWGLGALLFRPLWFFIRSYVVKQGFRDGKRGLIQAYLQGAYQAMLISKLHEERWAGQADFDHYNHKTDKENDSTPIVQSEAECNHTDI